MKRLRDLLRRQRPAFIDPTTSRVDLRLDRALRLQVCEVLAELAGHPPEWLAATMANPRAMVEGTESTVAVIAHLMARPTAATWWTMAAEMAAADADPKVSVALAGLLGVVQAPDVGDAVRDWLRFMRDVYPNAPAPTERLPARFSTPDLAAAAYGVPQRPSTSTSATLN